MSIKKMFLQKYDFIFIFAKKILLQSKKHLFYLQKKFIFVKNEISNELKKSSARCWFDFILKTG